MEKPLKARPLANNARRAGHPLLSVVKAWASPLLLYKDANCARLLENEVE